MLLVKTLDCVSFVSLEYHIRFSYSSKLIQPSEINILFVIPCPSSNNENEYCFAVHCLSSQCTFFCSYRVVKWNAWLFFCWVLLVFYYLFGRKQTIGSTFKRSSGGSLEDFPFWKVISISSTRLLIICSSSDCDINNKKITAKQNVIQWYLSLFTFTKKWEESFPYNL